MNSWSKPRDFSFSFFFLSLSLVFSLWPTGIFAVDKLRHYTGSYARIAIGGTAPFLSSFPFVAFCFRFYQFTATISKEAVERKGD